jgi:hypothetical protein
MKYILEHEFPAAYGLAGKHEAQICRICTHQRMTEGIPGIPSP